MSRPPRVETRSVAVAWLLVLAYGALITALSSLDKPPIPEGLQTTPGTLILHVLEFAGLSFLLFRALARSRPQWGVGRVVLVTIAVTAAFGVLDETHVHLYTRDTFRREVEAAGYRVVGAGKNSKAAVKSGPACFFT